MSKPATLMLWQVVGLMLPHIPKRERRLIAGLKAAAETSRFQSPQTQGLAWEKAIHNLDLRWPDGKPRSAWGKKIKSIWMGECA